MNHTRAERRLWYAGTCGTLDLVNDVVPLASGEWLARCECGATARFSDAESGWTWVLSHPCGGD